LQNPVCASDQTSSDTNCKTARHRFKGGLWLVEILL